MGHAKKIANVQNEIFAFLNPSSQQHNKGFQVKQKKKKERKFKS